MQLRHLLWNAIRSRTRSTNRGGSVPLACSAALSAPSAPRDFRAMTKYRRHPEVDPVALAEIIGWH